MAKFSKGIEAVPNKALHSRVSYLYQAATYLAIQTQQLPNSVRDEAVNEAQSQQACSSSGRTTPQATNQCGRDSDHQSFSRHLLSDLRSVSLKSQLRLSPAMKNSFCKRCNTMLIDGSTCISEVENKSKEGKKPWADVFVRKCAICGCEKRFPVGMENQARRHRRTASSHSTAGI